MNAAVRAAQERGARFVPPVYGATLVEQLLENNIHPRHHDNGEQYLTCPKCSSERRKSSAPCLSLTIDEGGEHAVWKCHHCDWAGAIRARSGYRQKPRQAAPEQPKPQRSAPVPAPGELTPQALKWLAERGISEAVARSNRVGSEQRYVPALNAKTECIAFPYYRNDELVNVKYRALNEKAFAQVKGAEAIAYGLDDIVGEKTIIFVEGEPDKLACEEAGIRNVISAPNGSQTNGNAPVDSASFKWITNCADYLDGAERFVFAGDNDDAGRALENELLRRLGRDRWLRVTWPDGCKDANDVLVRHSRESLAKCIEAAEPYPAEDETPDDHGCDARGALHGHVDGAAECEWPDPEPLFEPSEAERPYPVDVLPPIIANAIAEYHAYGQQPLSLIASSAMATVSLAAQGLVDVARDRRLVGPVSLHFTTIAASGERKTAADRTFSKPLREWMLERCEALQPEVALARAECAAWTAEREGLLNKIKAGAGKTKGGAQADLQALKKSLAELEARQPNELILPSLFFEDTNAASLAVDFAEGWPSASLWSDEGGLVVGSHGMSDDGLMAFVGLLNRLWDGQPFERRRRTTKSALIKGRRLTVSLMVQPIVFSQLLSAGGGASRGMGWIARNLIAYPTSKIGARPYKDAANMPSVDAFHRRLRELLDIELPVEGVGMALAPPVLNFSAPAFQVWRDFHDETEVQLSCAGEFGSIPDIGAKTAENAARIAGLLHVVTHGPGGSIDVATMESAAAVAAWHLHEARRIVGANESSQSAADAQLLIDWMLRQPGQTIGPREILQFGPNPLRNCERRDRAIEIMTTKHLVREISVQKATRLAVNPKVGGAA